MKVPAVRSHVVYFRNETVDGKLVRVSHDAIVVGYERPADHDPETDGLPMLTLAYAEPGEEGAFVGINWTDGFARAFSVPHEGVDNSGHHFYTFVDYEKIISDMNKGIAILRHQLEEKDAALKLALAPKLPSAADLDKVAAEDKVREITSGKKKSKE